MADLLGLALVSVSVAQDLFLFGRGWQWRLRPLQRAVSFQLSELLFVFGLLLLLRQRHGGLPRLRGAQSSRRHRRRSRGRGSVWASTCPTSSSSISWAAFSWKTRS